MRDLVGHDHLPSAFLVYLFFRGRATTDEANTKSGRRRMHPVTISVRELAAQTGLGQERGADCAESAAPKGTHSSG